MTEDALSMLPSQAKVELRGTLRLEFRSANVVEIELGERGHAENTLAHQTDKQVFRWQQLIGQTQRRVHRGGPVVGICGRRRGPLVFSQGHKHAPDQCEARPLSLRRHHLEQGLATRMLTVGRRMAMERVIQNVE